MFKDKLLIRFYYVLVVLLLILYYTGESRNRHWRETGFELCKKRGLEIWSTSCPEKESFFKKFVGGYND